MFNMHKTETFELFITPIRCCFVFVVFFTIEGISISWVHSAGASETVLYGYAPIEQILNNTKKFACFFE